MPRIDRSKRALGTAVRRSEPSRAASLLVERGLARGRVLDFGCCFGFDADHFGWDAWDPFYRPAETQGPFDTVVCTLVLNALSRNRRAEAIERIRCLLADDGTAYLAVARNLPPTGKLGIHHSLQNYVVLTLPSIWRDDAMEIYRMSKDARFEDETRDFEGRRDRARDG